MKAMVFAAGQGQRLRPLTDNLPKALVPVAGRPMIDYPLLLLRYYDIRDIIINLHHLGDQIEAYLGDGARLGLNISYSKEQQLLDTGGGLLKAKSFLQEESFVVINTDVLIDLPLAEVLAFHQQKQAAATLVVRPDKRAEQFGSMTVDSQGRIDRFLHAKRPAAASIAGTKLMFTGVQILDPEVFNYMPANADSEKFSTTKDTYPRMLIEERRLYGFRFEGFWQDLGTPPRIKEAEERLTQGRASLHYLE
jgi:NDP-sugar pyrophosphorylase family protein